MSKDPTMYPFSRKSQEYLIEFYYNPRSAPPHIQDKFGFLGEGMTDKNFLNTEVRKNYVWEAVKQNRTDPNAKDPKTGEIKQEITGWQLKELPGGQRVMYTQLKLSRDQLLRQGEWANRQPVVMTKNFDPKRVLTTDEDQKIIPLRSTTGSSAAGA